MRHIFRLVEDYRYYKIYFSEKYNLNCIIQLFYDYLINIASF